VPFMPSRHVLYPECCFSFRLSFINYSIRLIFVLQLFPLVANYLLVDFYHKEIPTLDRALLRPIIDITELEIF